MFADEEQHYKSSKRYKPLSRIEQAVPILFLSSTSSVLSQQR